MSLVVHEEMNHDSLDPKRISASLACRDERPYKLKPSYVLNHFERKVKNNKCHAFKRHCILTIVHEE